MKLKKEKKLKIVDINEYITCKLCLGYLIDATAIPECLHTFCKRCIVKYVAACGASAGGSRDAHTPAPPQAASRSWCPECNASRRVSSVDGVAAVAGVGGDSGGLRRDKQLQELLFALVPGLREKEERGVTASPRRMGGLPCSSAAVADHDTNRHSEERKGGARASTSGSEAPLHLIDLSRAPYSQHLHTAHLRQYDELITLELSKHPETPEEYGLQQRHVRCGVRTQVLHIKALLRQMLTLPITAPTPPLTLYCRGTELREERCSMKQVHLQYWGYTNSLPIVITYLVHDATAPAFH